MDTFRRKSSRLLLLTGMFVGYGLVTQARAENAQEPDGRELILRNCATCHAVDKIGESTNPMALPFRSLHELYPVESLSEALVEGILVGHPQMPKFRYSVQETRDIIAYLKSIQTDSMRRY